jgi:hypothetical protein
LNLFISDDPCTDIKTFFDEWQSKWLVAVINPCSEYCDCMLARACAVFDHIYNEHVLVDVIVLLECLRHPLQLKPLDVILNNLLCIF